MVLCETLISVINLENHNPMLWCVEHNSMCCSDHLHYATQWR